MLLHSPFLTSDDLHHNQALRAGNTFMLAESEDRPISTETLCILFNDAKF